MKKLYPLLSVLFLIYWGCEDPKEEETTPTEVTLWGVVYSIEDTDTLDFYKKLTEPKRNDYVKRVLFENYSDEG